MRFLILFLLLATNILLAGCEVTPVNDLDANKETVKKFIALSNDADWAQLSEVVASNLKRHSSATAGPPVRSLAEFIALQEGFLATFPDQHVRLDQIIAEGDFVAIRASYTGTQTGQMGEFPPTGKMVEGPFIAFFRIESGKIAELWVEWDNLVMLTQLGVFPPSIPASQ